MATVWQVLIGGGRRFWAWYERHYALNVGLVTVLFLLQLLHLFWLTSNVVVLRLLGLVYWPFPPALETIIILVDYTEIPALISVSILYLFELRKGRKFKPVFFLVLLNIQWLHLFWITDEFVVNSLSPGTPGTILPVWLAWVAILIDYLEVPVMIDTTLKFIRALKGNNVRRIVRDMRGLPPRAGE